MDTESVVKLLVVISSTKDQLVYVYFMIQKSRSGGKN